MCMVDPSVIPSWVTVLPLSFCLGYLQSCMSLSLISHLMSWTRVTLEISFLQVNSTHGCDLVWFCYILDPIYSCNYHLCYAAYPCYYVSSSSFCHCIVPRHFMSFLYFLLFTPTPIGLFSPLFWFFWSRGWPDLLHLSIILETEWSPPIFLGQ